MDAVGNPDEPTPSGVSPPARSPRPSSLRRWGTLLLPLIFGEGVLGILSAGQGTPPFPVLLYLHVTLGIVLAVLAGFVLVMALRLSQRTPRIVSAFTAGALWSTGATGAVFLITGFSQGAILDRGLALATLGGALLMIGHGRVAVPRGP